MNAKAEEAVKTTEQKTIKLDLGCGPNPRDGFIGVDSIAFNDRVFKTDLSAATWRFGIENFGEFNLESHDRGIGRWYGLPDNCVTEAHCSHFLEHLTGPQRVLFFNELYRVLTPGSGCLIITPHWASNRAYGDFTHQWPPVAEMMYYYLKKEWRDANAPHTDSKFNPNGYTCDFDATWGYGMRQDLVVRNAEYQNFAMQNYKEAVQDMHATVVKRAPPAAT